MARNGISKNGRALSSLRGLSKGATYRFSPDIGLELEIYATIKTHGSQKEILEKSLSKYFEENPIPKKLRDAALLILNGIDSVR